MRQPERTTNKRNEIFHNIWANVEFRASPARECGKDIDYAREKEEKSSKKTFSRVFFFALANFAILQQRFYARFWLQMLVNFNGKLQSDIKRTDADKTIKQAHVEIIIANAVAQFLIQTLAAGPEHTAIDSLLDDVL